MMMLMVLLAAVARLFPEDRERTADIQRVTAMASGDAAGLAALYDRHAPAIYSLALRIVREEGDAEDVVQEVFAQAWRQAGRYDAARGSVIAWLLIMTRTRAIDRLRMRQARPDRASAPDPSMLEQLASTDEDPSSGLVAEQEALRVRDALQALPMLQRVAIELAFFEGLSQSEIAERLEQPLGTVKTRIRLGLLKLRDVLGGAAT
jgi:RNA polymerase sigma-70 factor (ECF subfamily)